jgi:ABC-type glutathione transport system ATPase component
MSANPLEVRDLKVWFPVKKGVFARTVGYVKAVDGVSFDLRAGTTLGVVGESGSGKSMTARVVAGLVKATSGTVKTAGDVAMVFQDPLGSLNPRLNIRVTLEETVRHSRRGRGEALSPRQLLDLVGIESSALEKYPHEFSGGQRQRICIARAVAQRPSILICDEAVSALDLSIRSQILELLKDLKRRFELSLLFITHDLGVVNHIADDIIVMNKGRIIEKGPCGEVLKAPRENYTRNLVASVPRIGAANTVT